MPETTDGRASARSGLDGAIEAIINDPHLRRRMAIDPRSACAELGLSVAERTLLLSWLHEPT